MKQKLHNLLFGLENIDERIIKNYFLKDYSRSRGEIPREILL